jgi:hypothetical protein
LVMANLPLAAIKIARYVNAKNKYKYANDRTTLSIRKRA